MQHTKIYLARHGETEWNVAGIMQGQKDSLLTERGVAQAILLRNNLLSDLLLQGSHHNLQISAAYSSVLGRAEKTLKICTDGLGISRTSLPGLNEIALGDWEGLTFSEVERRWPEQFKNFWQYPSRYIPSGNGETFMQVQSRMVASIKELLQRHRGENLLVISHWIAIKSAMAYFMGLDIDDIPRIVKPPNGKYKILETREGEVTKNCFFSN